MKRPPATIKTRIQRAGKTCFDTVTRKDFATFAGMAGAMAYTHGAVTSALQFQLSAGYIAVAGAVGVLGGGLLAGLAGSRLYQRVHTKWFAVVGMPEAVSAIEYCMPDTPKFTDEFCWVLGEVHNGHCFSYTDFGTNGEPVLEVGDPKRPLDYNEKPEWFTIPAKAMYTNVAMFGATGASKTAGGARPLMKQYFAHAKEFPELKGAALIGDCKGSLVTPAIETAEEVGRTDDLYIIGPGRDAVWNPVYEPKLSPPAIVPRLLAAQENLSGSSPTAESRWIFDNNNRLLTGIVGILRMSQPNEYFTLLDISNTLVMAQAERSKQNGKEGVDLYATIINAFNKMHDDAKALKAKDPSRFYTQARWNHYTRLVAGVLAQNERHLSTVINQAETLLAPWSDPDVSSKYCPTYEELMEKGFRGFDWALDTGKIVVMDCPASIYSDTARAVATFLKLAFQRAILGRPSRWREKNSTANKTRPALLLIDEYQEMASASGEEGDDRFLALNRESKCMCVFFTQSPSSIIARLGADRTKVLLANLRTKIFQNQVEPSDRQFAADTCGKEWRGVENVTITGTADNAKMSGAGDYLADRTSVTESVSIVQQEVYRFDPSFFRNVPVLTCVVDTFDGNSPVPASVVRLKAFFEPWERTQKETVERMRWAAYEKAYSMPVFAQPGVTPPPPPDTDDQEELDDYIANIENIIAEAGDEAILEEPPRHGLGNIDQPEAGELAPLDPADLMDPEDRAAMEAAEAAEAAEEPAETTPELATESASPLAMLTDNNQEPASKPAEVKGVLDV